MAATTLKLDWDDDTIGAVRVACLATTEIYEALGSLPGFWNLNDAVRLRTAAADIRTYIESREQVKQSIVVSELLKRKHTQEQENPS